MHAGRGSTRRDAGRGFTLLELVVVIVLLAAVNAMAADVVGRHLPGQQLRRA
jgi:prepilin-type N-terminal cleavage/methylation domain-containing protein